MRASDTMEELAMFDWLECPLCLEPLDVTAKVLPCQHTFCRPCLQRQEATHYPMYCPECRSPVPGTVDELPTNLLLVRLLEGIQEGPQGSLRHRHSRYSDSLTNDNSVSSKNQDLQPTQYLPENGTEKVYAQALSNYQTNVPGALPMQSGDIINLRWRIGDNWYYGDTKGSSGLVPSNMVEVTNKEPQPVAMCQACYDFDVQDLDPKDTKDCLTFRKGDIITVIKPVDENWIEGKLGDKIGIFPLQFTEPNSVALRLLERHQRRDSTESRPQVYRGSDEKAIGTIGNPGGQRHHPGGFHYHSRPPNIGFLNKLNLPTQSYGQQPRQSAAPVPQVHRKPSRGSSLPQLSGNSRRSLPKAVRRMSSETPPTITMALINPQASPVSSENKQSSPQQLSISVCAALYSYIPHRSEELELRKGEMVGVYGKFKEGWLRGLSLRTGKVGILPANYVTPVLRTSARILEQPKLSASNSGTVHGKRDSTQKSQAVVLALDRVNTEGAVSSAVPTVSVTQQPVMPSVGAVRSSQLGGKQGWDSVRRAFHHSHRGSIHRGSYHPQNPTSGLKPLAQDLGQIYGFGRSPVLPRKRNGLFTNPIKPQNFTYDGTVPPGGRWQTADKDASKESSLVPHSILVKPDSQRHTTDKPMKSVRFLNQDEPQATMRTSLSSGGLVTSNSQAGPSVLEMWNPSAILGRDGSASVLKNAKTLAHWRGMGQDHSMVDGSFSSKSTSSQYSPSRHRVVTGHNAPSDAELNLREREAFPVQKPRQEGRVLVNQESSGKTGLFQNSVVDILDQVV